MFLRRFFMTSSGLDASVIEANLGNVRDRILSSYKDAPIDLRSPSPVRLVAVSKTKPVSSVLAAYRAGQRHFGENYVQELIAKSNDPEIVSECTDIRWHFIGHLQSNKITKLIHTVPNLFLVETVDSISCAKKIDAAVRSLSAGDETEPLRVMVEVNTSGEEQKSGLNTEEAMELAATIRESCSALRFIGFMTIGSFDHTGDGENPDFLRLVETRRVFCEKYSIERNSIELSMGMSADFESAIKMGASNVRVGSTIFGARATKQ